LSETTISGPRPRGRPDLAELRPLVGAALASYGLMAAELQNLRYYNNATYRVAATDGQQYVLRVTSNHHDEAALHAEMTWLVSMRAHPDVHTPRPVAAMDGRLLTSASAPALDEPRRCALFGWMEGAHPLEERMMAADFARLGAAVAGLHRASAAFRPPPGFSRPRWFDLDCLHPERSPLHAGILDHLGQYFPAVAVRRFDELVLEGRALVGELGLDPRHHGLVHGDLHAGNELFHADFVGFIDFEDLSWGYFVHDIASALFASLDRAAYPALVEAFITAYDRVRPLPVDATHQLLLFQVLRGVFLTSLVILRGDAGERTWWQANVAPRLESVLLGRASRER
jgi:Ser/Thr protein kinase RdoA (MazF antagonist)